MPTPVEVTPTVPAAIRTGTVVWAAFLVTQFLFVVMTWFVKTKVSPADPVISYALLGVGVMAVVASHVIKGMLMAKAAAAHDLKRAMQAQIVAMAMCESASILGLISFFTLGSTIYLMFFVVSLVGIVTHFPRRSQFEATEAVKPIL